MPISPQPRSGLKSRLFSLALGVLCAAVLLELGLRFVGLGFLFLQERRNRVTLRHPGAYRILCVGDSMTAGTYPRYLEEILNARGAGRRFAVIDEGRLATTSRQALATLPEHLAKYRPDMVLAMMGANDVGEVLLYGGVPASGGSSLRILRLAGFLRYLAAQRWPGRAAALAPRIYGPPQRRSSPEAEARTASVKAGRTLLDQGKVADAAAAFSRALRRFPEEPELLIGLGDCYAVLGESDRPRKLFERAVRRAPPGLLYFALRRLGWHCREHGQFQAAEDAFRRAMRLEPRQSSPYRELGMISLLRGRSLDATAWFEKAVAVDPRNSGLLVLLGGHYLHMGRQADAAQAYLRAAEADPNDPLALGGLATCYGLLGQTKLARQARAKANALRERRFVAMTRDNYRRILQLVSASGARLVCIQYPRRSVAELRNLFDDPSGIIFVDNEAPFERALRAAPLGDYFIDFFGGDFGHCTEKGYRLLAADIADVILKAFPPR
ncbi:MAG: tetratricopeptide repeat protein [Elusimicrobia bacterium]|nr:tetratricopeptide repeat protein [Elusimicrobiota bacterium]